MSNIVIGIDPSLTGLAVATWREDQDVPEIVRLSSKPCGALVAERFKRYDDLLDEMRKHFEATPYVESDVALTVIEGYSFASPFKASILGEFGGMLRHGILKSEHPLIEVAPAALKKFATGKGQGKKPVVAAHVAKRWGFIGETDDHTDAYVLGRIGRAYLGWDECDNQAQREVIEQLRNPEKPKRRRAKA